RPGPGARAGLIRSRAAAARGPPRGPSFHSAARPSPRGWGMPESTHPPHVLGRRAESLAARVLVARGWSILAANYRFGRREVDLVARRGDLVAFVEVKARSGPGYGPPEAAVT